MTYPDSWQQKQQIVRSVLLAPRITARFTCAQDRPNPVARQTQLSLVKNHQKSTGNRTGAAGGSCRSQTSKHILRCLSPPTET